MPGTLTARQRHVGWIVTIAVGAAALSISLNLYTTLAIRAEQVQNTARVENASQTLAIVKAVEATINHNHSTSRPLLVNICHALPGCVVPPE